MPNNKADIFFEEQLKSWPLAKENFKKLENIKRKVFDIDGSKVIAQFNPERVKSSTAKVDEKSIKERKCFLCKNNLPLEQKINKLYKGFNLLVNPFPIFPKHFTIVNEKHIKQEFENYIDEFITISELLKEKYTLFFNGAKCGASAPDHLHFQAGNMYEMPLDKEFKEYLQINNKMHFRKNTFVFVQEKGIRNFIGIYSSDSDELQFCLKILLSEIKNVLGKDSDNLNIISSFIDGYWQVSIFIREKHRPDFYFSEDEETKLIISPASVDMGGILIFPYEKDFAKINKRLIKEIYKEVIINVDLMDEIVKNIS